MTTRVVVGAIGSAGSTGNGLLGTVARVNFPRTLTLTGASGADLLFADSGVHMVRVLYANQTIRNLMGIGSSGYSGDLGLGEHVLQCDCFMIPSVCSLNAFPPQCSTACKNQQPLFCYPGRRRRGVRQVCPSASVHC